MVLHSEPFSGAAEAGLGLVNNEQRAMSVREIFQSFHIAGGRNDHSAGRDNWFDNYRCKIVRGGNASFNRTFQAKQIAFRIAGVNWAMKTMGSQQPVSFWNARSIAKFSPEYGSEALGGQRQPVIPPIESHHAILFRVHLGDGDGAFICFGAGGKNHGAFQLARRDFGKLRRSLQHDRAHELTPYVNDLAHLLDDFFDEPRMAVAQNAAELARGEVQGFIAVDIFQNTAVRFADETVGIRHADNQILAVFLPEIETLCIVSRHSSPCPRNPQRKNNSQLIAIRDLNGISCCLSSRLRLLRTCRVIIACNLVIKTFDLGKLSRSQKGSTITSDSALTPGPYPQ